VRLVVYLLSAVQTGGDAEGYAFALPGVRALAE
jgi:hypothetical protein